MAESLPLKFGSQRIDQEFDGRLDQIGTVDQSLRSPDRRHADDLARGSRLHVTGLTEGRVEIFPVRELRGVDRQQQPLLEELLGQIAGHRDDVEALAAAGPQLRHHLVQLAEVVRHDRHA